MSKSNYLFWLYNSILDYDILFKEIITNDLKEIIRDDYDEDLKELYEVLNLKTDSNVLTKYIDLNDPRKRNTKLVNHILIPLLNYKTVYDSDKKIIGLSTFGGDYTNCYIPVTNNNINFTFYLTLVKLMFIKYLDNTNTIVKQINNFSYLQKLITSDGDKKWIKQGLITPSFLYKLLKLNYKYVIKKDEPSTFDSTVECDLFEYNLFYLIDFIVKDILSVDNLLQIKSQLTRIKNNYFDSKRDDKINSDICSICHNIAINPLDNNDCNYCYFNKY
ncbi:hypothetical protein HANVADRAFT_51141, partial [Hanseniaspora valbyensis NRRL Y-1626]